MRNKIDSPKISGTHFHHLGECLRVSDFYIIQLNIRYGSLFLLSEIHNLEH